MLAKYLLGILWIGLDEQACPSKLFIEKRVAVTFAIQGSSLDKEAFAKLAEDWLQQQILTPLGIASFVGTAQLIWHFARWCYFGFCMRVSITF